MGTKQAKKLRKELRRIGVDKIMADVQSQAGDELAKTMYNKLITSVKPRPRWMPKFIHEFLVGMLLEVKTNEHDRRDDQNDIREDGGASE